MATPAQIAANRANAQKSTGPRSVEGKAASCFNALKHGMDAASIVIPGENPAEYERIANNYYDEFRPASALEEFHVDTLIRSDWQKRRLQRIEGKLYRALVAEGANPEDLDIAALRDSPTAKLLRKVFSQMSSLERSLFRALADLRRIRRERENAPAPAEDGGAGLQDRAVTAELASFPESKSPDPSLRLRAENPAPNGTNDPSIS